MWGGSGRVLLLAADAALSYASHGERPTLLYDVVVNVCYWQCIGDRFLRAREGPFRPVWAYYAERFLPRRTRSQIAASYHRIVADDCCFGVPVSSATVTQNPCRRKSEPELLRTPPRQINANSTVTELEKFLGGVMLSPNETEVCEKNTN